MLFTEDGGERSGAAMSAWRDVDDVEESALFAQ